MIARAVHESGDLIRCLTNGGERSAWYAADLRDRYPQIGPMLDSDSNIEPGTITVAMSHEADLGLGALNLLEPA